MQTKSRPPNETYPRLPPPDPLSTVLLYVGAVVMALDTALAPGSNISLAAPALTMGGIWPFVPIALMSAAALIWIARGLRAGAPRDRRESER
ncbi:MAG TPA: hypothetical protein VG227_07395 [Caulobacteraceae bacterium]|nr:hypothetical protein [Caulobacteraceae bacterium]